MLQTKLQVSSAGRYPQRIYTGFGPETVAHRSHEFALYRRVWSERDAYPHEQLLAASDDIRAIDAAKRLMELPDASTR